MPSDRGSEVQLRLPCFRLQVISQDLARLLLHGPAVVGGFRSKAGY